MRLFGKGAVWVNGNALGRFGNIGPQQTLYLPGAWLKKGANEVIVFELTPGADAPKLHGLARPILDSLATAGTPE